MAEESKFTYMGRQLPRVPFGHAVISPTCREVQPDALVEAVQRMRQGYDDVVARRSDVQVHVLLVATWPEDEDA